MTPEASAALGAVALTVLVATPRRPAPARSSDGASPPPGPRRAAAGRSVGPAGARFAIVVIVAAAALAAGTVAAVLVAVVVVGGRRLLRLVEERRRARRIERALPDLVDLVRLAAGSGLPVIGSLAAVAPRAPAVLGDPLGLAVSQLDHGVDLRAVLAELDEELGLAGGPLIAALDRSAATGAALGELLGPVAADGHERRRRHAQEAAHRLPVSLLLPLAGCVLPAAIVLAIVPVVAVALGDLTP